MENVDDIIGLEDFFQSFDWVYYDTENKDIQLSDHKSAWTHANSIGWKEKRRIYENTKHQ